MGNANRFHHAKAITGAFLLITCASPAFAGSTLQAEFAAKTADDALSSIASTCAKRGMSVASRTEKQVLCEGEPEAVTALKVLSSRHLIATKGVMTFSVLSSDATATRVQGSGFTEVINTFGATREVAFEWENDLQSVLTESGGKIASD